MADSGQTSQGVDWRAPPRLLPNGFPAHTAWLSAGSSARCKVSCLTLRDNRTQVATTRCLKDSLQPWPERAKAGFLCRLPTVVETSALSSPRWQNSSPNCCRMATKTLEEHREGGEPWPCPQNFHCFPCCSCVSVDTCHSRARLPQLCAHCPLHQGCRLSLPTPHSAWEVPTFFPAVPPCHLHEAVSGPRPEEGSHSWCVQNFSSPLAALATWFPAFLSLRLRSRLQGRVCFCPGVSVCPAQSRLSGRAC